MWGPIRQVRGCSEPTGTLSECPAKVSADSTQLCVPSLVSTPQHHTEPGGTGTLKVLILSHGLSQGATGHKKDQKACGLMKLLVPDKYI